MRRTGLIVASFFILAASTLWAQPTIRAESGVLNASSYLPDIARGSWFVIFGTGLGPANIVVYSGAVPFPTELAGTRVTFTPAAGGTAIDARLWYTLAGQLAGLLPSTAAAGDYDVRVIFNNQTSAPRRVKVVDRAFGFATQAQNGSGPAQATYGGLDLNRFTTGTLGQYTTRPARTSDTMILWGTGLGADPSSDVNGASSGDQTAAAQVRVIVGGIEVTPAYAGRSPGAPGLDQINFTVPTGVAPNCFVSIQVRAGGRTSNLGTIAVAEAGRTACTHPTFSEAQLITLDRGGTLTIGAVSMAKLSTRVTVPIFGTFDTITEGISASFDKFNVDAVSSANFSALQIGACYLFRRSGDLADLALGTAPSPLDAGAVLTLNGPNAVNRAIPRVTNSKSFADTFYSSGIAGVGASGSPTIAQGTYTISGTGGADVGAFSASVDVPGNFVWTNQDAVNTIARSAGQNITWTGGGSGIVLIFGGSVVQTGGSLTDGTYDAVFFQCSAQASAGSFTIPGSVLQQVPAVGSDPTSGNFGNLTVMTIPDVTRGQGSFSAPLTAGGRTDFATFMYSIGASKTVAFN
jgi:uncharacterized protein (TIGR03437 family)